MVFLSFYCCDKYYDKRQVVYFILQLKLGEIMAGTQITNLEADIEADTMKEHH